jgi:hypothetical protein
VATLETLAQRRSAVRYSRYAAQLTGPDWMMLQVPCHVLK